MIIQPFLAYVLGAAAAAAALLIIIPVKAGDIRRNPLRAAFATLALALPPLLILLSTSAQDSGIAGSSSSMADMGASATGTGEMAQEDDWSNIARALLPDSPAGAAAAAAQSGSAAARAQRSAAEMAIVTQREPRNVEAWLAMAQAHRLAREYPTAIAAYESALKIDDRNADAWADYADALASANSRRLSGAPAAAISRALKLNPSHLKGLWLQASLDLEQRRYGDALAHWRKLRAALPADSPDIAVIDSNIAEAIQLAAQPASRS